jgi:exopolyphosphatase/guanosine-5'-triphosphate,3'-diphosphate pyrophosphatase
VDPAQVSRDTSVGAAVDIGSNSVHLLVGVTGTGFLSPLRDTSELMGLGDVVAENPEIPAQTRRAVIDVLADYVAAAQRSSAQRFTLLGTDPLRRASNAVVLAAEIREALGLELRVLSEHEEAVLAFIGVTRGELQAKPIVVVDIGGGSTQVVSSNPGKGLEITSIGLGSGRLTNAIVQHDPPTEGEITALFERAITAVAAAGITVAGVERAVFVGGTATNVARLGLLTRTQMAADRQTLGKPTQPEISTHYSVRPRRARQLAAGVAIVDALLASFGLIDAEVSDASLRDGAIIAAATFGDEWPARMAELTGGLIPA